MARILIIEDNPLNMKLATLLVSRAGHSTLGAVDAESGLLLARNKLPDLILMDIQLPGMNGFELASAIRAAEPPEICKSIMAMTASAGPGDAEHSRIAGMNEYLLRPLHLAKLRTALLK